MAKGGPWLRRNKLTVIKSRRTLSVDFLLFIHNKSLLQNSADSVQLLHMKIIARLLLNALALLIIAYYIDGITVDTTYAAIIAAIILSILNAVVRPILFVLTLPITLLTLGLFSFVINATLFLFAASFIDGFSVENFWFALIGSLLLSIVSSVSNKILD